MKKDDSIGSTSTSSESAGGNSGAANKKSDSAVVIFGAIAADAAVAIAKFVAAGLSGSSSMLAEGIHSVVDTANTCLLLLGQKRARRAPDELHPFGHGREIYFWSLLVAMIIFGLGGGTGAYEGITHLLHPRNLESPTISYWVLAISAIFCTASFLLSFRQFSRQKRTNESWWQTFRRSKDPITFTVVLEDAAALVGILIAFLGIFLGHTLDNPYCDGVASLCIGLMMATVACLLAWESRGLLVGESADPQAVEHMRQLAMDDPDVDSIKHALSMQLGPNEVLLTLDVVFRNGLTVPQLAAVVDRLEKTIRQHYPEVRQIFIEAQAINTANPENHPGK